MSARPSSFEAAWSERLRSLSARARGGSRWGSVLKPLLPAGYLAAARWIGIESGGDPTTTTPLQERGLAQTMRSSVSAEWWGRLVAAKTRAEHAALAVREIRRDVARAIGDRASPTDEEVGFGKIYHGVPRLVVELRGQGLLRPTVRETVEAAVLGYKPSLRMSRFVARRPSTGVAAQDLALRFLAPAYVVAYGDARNNA